MSEGIVVASILAVVAGQAFVSFALFAWGRWVSRRHAAAFWRHASRVPLVAFVLAAAGYALTVIFIVRSFDSVSQSTPQEKARNLAEGISNAMNAAALLWFPASVLYTASLVVFIVGSIRKPTATSP
jgi:hypothetical protein